MRDDTNGDGLRRDEKLQRAQVFQPESEAVDREAPERDFRNAARLRADVSDSRTVVDRRPIAEAPGAEAEVRFLDIGREEFGVEAAGGLQHLSADDHGRTEDVVDRVVAVAPFVPLARAQIGKVERPETDAAAAALDDRGISGIDDDRADDTDLRVLVEARGCTRR